MFGLFAPRCPLDTAYKAWVELKMRWLAARFGVERARAARVVLPTPEFFPDPYTADDASARRCLDRVCGYMSVDPGTINLTVLPDEHMPGAAGWYLMRAKGDVCVAHSQLADPERLIATLAHEVAHDILLRGGHLTGDEPDHEQVTDLLPAFLGIGAFAANGTLREFSWSDGNMSGWGSSAQGYLTSVVHGYALAVFAFVRGEQWPKWRKLLRPDARGSFEKGLRFLQKTGDALVTPENAGTPRPTPTAATALDALTGRSATARVAALWDVMTAPLTDPALLDPMVDCLSHPDEDVRSEAARALPVLGPPAAAAVPQLIAMLTDDYGTREAAAYALGKLRADPKAAVPELIYALRDPHGETSWEVVKALRAYGPDAAAALPALLPIFEKAVSDGDPLTAVLGRALAAVSPDAARALRDHMRHRDPEATRFALSELADVTTEGADSQSDPEPWIWGIPLPRARP